MRLLRLTIPLALLASLLPALSASASEPTAGLWFKVPDNILTQQRMVFAHWWPMSPGRFTNTKIGTALPAAERTEATDWFSTHLNNPFDSRYYPAAVPYGGESRSRPLFYSPTTSSNWEVMERKADIKLAYSRGLDGFMADTINTWKPRITALAMALRELRAEDSKYSQFYIIPMIDADSPGATSPTSAASDWIAAFRDTSLTVSNKMVWAAWRPDGPKWTVNTWVNIQKDLTNRKGIPNTFLPTFLNSYSAKAAQFSGAMDLWGEGPWEAGNADPGSIADMVARHPDYGGGAASRGNKYMHPVRHSEARYGAKGKWFIETEGTRGLAASWSQAITWNAPLAQMVTWHDYTENTSFAPSASQGYVPVDLSSWYITKWKTGQSPAILDDTALLAHRTHLAKANPNPTVQTTKTTQRIPYGNDGTPVRDIVEARVFLTAPATVRIITQAGPTTFNAPAGESTYTAPLVVGAKPRVEVVRNSTVVASVQSTKDVLSTPWRTDMQYWMFSSARGTHGQARTPGPQSKYL